MTALLLVRHAAVARDASARASDWPLTPAGRADADRLATWGGWRGVAVVATSDEPKAVGTAEPIAQAAGVPVRREHAFREVDRSATPALPHDAYVALVARYLAGARVPGWEDRGGACARFTDGVESLVQQASGAVAIVGHGLIFSVYLNLRVDQWQVIPMPAVALVDAATQVVRERFRGVDELLDDDARTA